MKNSVVISSHWSFRVDKTFLELGSTTEADGHYLLKWLHLASSGVIQVSGSPESPNWFLKDNIYTLNAWLRTTRHHLSFHQHTPFRKEGLYSYLSGYIGITLGLFPLRYSFCTLDIPYLCFTLVVCWSFKRKKQHLFLFFLSKGAHSYLWALGATLV